MLPNDELPHSAADTSSVVPIEFAGQWIAWNRDGTRIVANGRTLQEVAKNAKAAEETQPVFAKVPKSDIRFAGLKR